MLVSVNVMYIIRYKSIHCHLYCVIYASAHFCDVCVTCTYVVETSLPQCCKSGMLCKLKCVVQVNVTTIATHFVYGCFTFAEQFIVSRLLYTDCRM